MRVTIVKSIAQVIGFLWMPGCLASQQITLSSYDLENMKDDTGEFTRDSVERWIYLHCGDFQSIADFRVEIEDGEETIVFDWEKEDSEFKFYDCMYSDLD